MPLASLTRPLWRNRLVLAAGLATMLAVLGAGLAVRAIAEREDALRGAETGLAELAPLAVALRVEALNVDERRAATPGDVTSSRRLGRATVGVAEAVARHWDGDGRTAVLVASSKRAVALNRVVIGRSFAGDLAGSERAMARLLPATRSLSAQIRSARAALSDELDHRQGQVLGFVLAISALVGAGLIALMAGVVAARRRSVRGEAERAALRASEGRLRELVRHGSDMVAVVAADTTISFAAGPVEDLLGLPPEQLAGTRLSEWVEPDDEAELRALCAAAGRHPAGRELRFRRRDGTRRTCEARATALPEDANAVGTVLNVWDVSERKQLEERLRHQAFHDALTGLANRTLFADRLEQALRRGARGGHPVTVMMIDLDDFKAINDSFGHAAGDRLLVEVATRLQARMRAADTVARLGGDEFGVILDEADRDGIAAVQRVFAAVEEPFEMHGRRFPITASVGVASSNPGETEVDDLVRSADLAMYAAKAQGRGRWTAFEDDMFVAAEDRLRLKADLALAVAAGEQISLEYQPVVDLDSGELIGLEALLRWQHAERGAVEPTEFVPLAEESGAIIPLGRWALKEACRRARAWSELAGVPLLVGVNVSPRQLADESFVADVSAALESAGLPPSQLLLEITESEVMGERDRAIAILRALKRLGVWIAIDDFGTGYSSLGRLERLPVDVLKVSRSLAAAGESPEQDRLLGAVAEIGRSLGLRTVIEGVETPEQLAEAGRLQFGFCQGYVFARPMSAEAVTQLLRDNPPSRRGEGGRDPRPVLQPSAE